MDDSQGQLRHRWYISLPVALLIVFPIALDMVSGTFRIIPRLEDDLANARLRTFLEATFTWLIVFASIVICSPSIVSPRQRRKHVAAGGSPQREERTR